MQNKDLQKQIQIKDKQILVLRLVFESIKNFVVNRNNHESSLKLSNLKDSLIKAK